MGSKLVVHTVFPLAGGRVDDTKEFVVGDGLGVEVLGNRLSLHVLVGFEERLPHTGFACAGITYNEDGMTHLKELLQLDNLQEKGRKLKSCKTSRKHRFLVQLSMSYCTLKHIFHQAFFGCNRFCVGNKASNNLFNPPKNIFSKSI